MCVTVTVPNRPEKFVRAILSVSGLGQVVGKNFAARAESGCPL
jgi:hypothetical protein